ncbi:UNVERIFIED_CONTAM: hypothetical protein Sindi_1850000, partial [Sesamum indicum]
LAAYVEKINFPQRSKPRQAIIATSEKYNRVWMLEGSKPKDVREWYDFGALASVDTMSPSFPKISKLSEWMSGAVFDSWQNNPHLKRGDVLEIKFVSVAPETVGKGSHTAFHFMKLQRPDIVAFNKIKAASDEAPLVSITEDNISTRRVGRKLSLDSGETTTIESQEVQTPNDSSQPNTSMRLAWEISLRPMTGTSKVNINELISSSAWLNYQHMWEKLISCKGVNPGKTNIETSKKYNRVWMFEGSKLEDVREWYDFGAPALVHTMSPSFPKISKLSEWISGAVFDSWQNNPHLKRGDALEIKFISVAPETTGKGSHTAFHFMKLQRPDMVAFNKIKAASSEALLVSAITEGSISTKRSWGLWICLTEMDKVKYLFKIFSNKVN